MPDRIDIDLVRVLEALIERLRDELGLNEDTCFWMLEDGQPPAPAPADLFVTVSPDGGQFDGGLIVGGGANQLTVETGIIVTVWSACRLDAGGQDVHFLTSSSGVGPMLTNVILALSDFDPTFGVDVNPALRELIRPTGFVKPFRNADDSFGGVSIHFDVSFDWGLPAVTETTTNIQPSAATGTDSYIVDGSSATGNFGSEVDLYIGTFSLLSVLHVTRSIIRFNLSSIPAGADIVSATLTLTVSGGTITSPQTFSAVRVTQSFWTEAGVTWNKYDGTNNWTTVGGDYTLTDGDTVSMSAAAGTVVFDNLLDLVNDAIDNRDGYLHLLLTGPESGVAQFLAVHSSDSATSASRPKLSVTYTT